MKDALQDGSLNLSVAQAGVMSDRITCAWK